MISSNAKIIEHIPSISCTHDIVGRLYGCYKVKVSTVGLFNRTQKEQWLRINKISYDTYDKVMIVSGIWFNGEPFKCATIYYLKTSISQQHILVLRPLFPSLGLFWPSILNQSILAAICDYHYNIDKTANLKKLQDTFFVNHNTNPPTKT